MLGPALERLGIRGLAELDAKRVLAKATTAESGPNLNNVEELIASGDLQGARRLFTSLTDDQADEAKSERQKAVAAHLSDAEAKKREAVEAYQKAIKVQDYDKAQQALSRARTMDREDADLARWMEQLPPATPASLRATFSAESGGIVLSWRSTQSSEVRYAVVRSDAGVPANPKDGHQIVAASTDEKVTDKAPPIARKLTYAVFAFKQGAQYSLPASVEVTVLPPPTDVETALTSSEATLFWRVPPQATGVSVELVKPDGSHQSFPASAREKLVIGDLKLGEKYKLTLTAHYVLANGQHWQSTPVSVDATPRGAALPVLDLRVASVAMLDGRPGLRAEWTDVPGYPIDLWSLPIDVTVKASSRVKASTLEDLGGKRVVGSIRASAVHHVMDFYAFQDVRTALPVTWNGDEGIAGASVVAGSAPPPKNVEAIRYGQVLVVSWHWPNGNYLMDVAWTARDDTSGRMRVDWHAYNRDGGVHIPGADLVTDVSVGTVATGGGREYVFDPVHIRLQTACPSIAYQIKLPRGLFGGRQAEVYATSPHFHGFAEVIAVLAPGSFMPARASDGQEIARLALDFRHATTHRASFPVPKIKSPYWVRLFPAREGEIALEDPPTTSMKV
jgi:hypothetical protein